MLNLKNTIIAAAFIVILSLILALTYNHNSGYHRVVVERGKISSTVAATGKVEPLLEVQVASKTLGRVKEIYFKEGDFVKNGDVVAVLENNEIEAQLEQAESALELAKAELEKIEKGSREEEIEQARANLNRYKAELEMAKLHLKRFEELYQRGIVSKSELDDARAKHDMALAEYEASIQNLNMIRSGAREEERKAARAKVKKAEADVRYAEAMLENTIIKAPISGKVIRKYMDAGETITFENLVPIVTIADISKIRVVAEVDETDIRKVKLDQEAVVTTNAYPGEEFRGKVMSISAVAGKKTLKSEEPAEMVDTRVLEVKIELDDGDRLTLGLNVDVEILVTHKENVLVLPLEAVKRVNREAFVKVRENGTLKDKKIVTGVDDDYRIEVVEGLEEGDEVFIEKNI